MNKYKTVECPYCNGIFITKVDEEVICIYCGRMFKGEHRIIYSEPKVYEGNEVSS